jgi:hypothetical protein
MEILSDKISNLINQIDAIDALLEIENIHYSGSDYLNYDKDTDYYYYEDEDEDEDKDKDEDNELPMPRITTDSRVLQAELIREELKVMCNQMKKEGDRIHDEYQRGLEQRKQKEEERKQREEVMKQKEEERKFMEQQKREHQEYNKHKLEYLFYKLFSATEKRKMENYDAFRDYKLLLPIYDIYEKHNNSERKLMPYDLPSNTKSILNKYLTEDKIFQIKELEILNEFEIEEFKEMIKTEIIKTEVIARHIKPK